MRTFTYEIESVTVRPDFIIRQPEYDGLEIISNRTGNHYTLLEGMGTYTPTGKQFSSDIMFIMLLTKDEDGEYIYANNAFVNYIAGAEYINALEDWALQGVFKYINNYEDKLLHK